MQNLNSIADIQAQFRSLGLLTDLKLRPLNRKYLRVYGVKVPEIIAEYLSQIDSPEVEKRDDGGLAWHYKVDPQVMHHRDVYVPALQERFHMPIRAAGGDVVRMLEWQQCLIYPRSMPYMRSMFSKVGFGLDDYQALFPPRENDPANDPAILNAPARVQRRLEDALAIFDEINADQNQPMVLERISRTSACLQSLTHTPPERKWADLWATRVWDYYVRHKAEASDERMFDAVHSFNKKECFRSARKFGSFNIGG